MIKRPTRHHLAHAMTTHLHYFSGLLRLRSPWYYWYCDRKLVAVGGMGLGMSIMAGFAMLTSGFGLIPLVLALALDHVIILLPLFYLILRWSLPNWLPISFADGFMLKQFLLIAVPGILAVRIATFCVASMAGRGAQEAVHDTVEDRPGTGR